MKRETDRPTSRERSQTPSQEGTPTTSLNVISACCGRTPGRRDSNTGKLSNGNHRDKNHPHYLEQENLIGSKITF